MRVKPIQDIPQQEVDFLPILCLDRSSSMSGGKFKNAVKGIKKLVTEFQEGIFIEFGSGVTTKKFKNGVIEPTSPSGSTALNDAILYAYNEAQSSGKKCLINVTSDGEENNSKTSTKEAKRLIQELIKQQHTFSFVCTKEDYKTIKDTYGVEESNILTYENNAEGVNYAFKMSMDATRMYKSSLAKGEDVTLGFYSKVLNK